MGNSQEIKVSVYEVIHPDLDGLAGNKPERGIPLKMGREGIPVLSAGRHRLYLLDAPRPHTPKGSSVYWVTQSSTDLSIMPWGNSNAEMCAEDWSFWIAVGRLLHQRQVNNPHLRFNMFIGYNDRKKQELSVNNLHLTRERGLQSIKRFHIHELDTTFTNFTNPQKHLSLNQIGDHEALAIVGNCAGEISISLLGQMLEKFGSSFVYPQYLGDDSVLKRTIYGFATLDEAVYQTQRLQKSAEKIWPEHVLEVNSSYAQINGMRLDVKNRQCPVPSFSIIVPSEDDWQYVSGTVDREAQAVWVMPFATCSAVQALTPGGAWFDYVIF